MPIDLTGQNLILKGPGQAYRGKIIISEKDSCLPLWKNIREEINSWSWN